MKSLKKWNKILIAVAVVLIVIGAGVFDRSNYESGSSNIWYFPDIDSAQTYVSEWFDATGTDGQTLVLNYYVKGSTNQSTLDTLRSLVLEGRSAPGGNISTATANLLIDTVDNVARMWGTTIGPMARITVPYTGVVGHITLTPSNQYPQWRWKVVGDGINTQLLLNLYSKVQDYQANRLTDGR